MRMSITDILKSISLIKDSLDLKMSKFSLNKLTKTSKSDGSIVTEYDLYISDLVRDTFAKHGLSFYSEEQKSDFSFPLIILDPIDGTKEFASGIPECVISFGIYFSENLSDEKNFSWIYNFFTKEELFSYQLTNSSCNNDKVFISRTEFELGLHKNKNLVYTPVGSIAYKLMLLAKSKCRYVISSKPKNIWDITAGSHILDRNGFALYESGKRITKIENRKYGPDLVWCKEEDYEELISKMKN